MKKYSFLFGYAPGYWEALERQGFHGPWKKIIPGLRLIHSSLIPTTHDKFNERMKNDRGLLAALSLCPYFLIDRGVGGSAYTDYSWDQDLLRQVDGQLDEKFLGIQVNEYTHNTLTDWSKVTGEGGLVSSPGRMITSKDVTNAFHVRGHVPNYKAPQDFVGKTLPLTAEAMVEDIYANVRKFISRFAGYFTAVDTMCFYWSFDLAFRLKARAVLVEAGAAVHSAGQINIAAAAGAARSYHCPWGLYYALWSVLPLPDGSTTATVTCYLGKTLWGDMETGHMAYKRSHTFGGKGGGSIALTRRLFHYAAMAGARLFTEEWGPENTFHNWHNFEITPHGVAMKEFLEFLDKTELGEPYKPVALVYQAPGPALGSVLDKPGSILRFYPDNESHRLRREFLRGLVQADKYAWIPGREEHSLMNSPIPAMWEFVASDAPPEVLDSYEYFIWLCPEQTLPATLQTRKDVCRLEDPAAALEQVKKWSQRCLPFWVEGDCLWCVNRTANTWLVGLFNNRGVARDKNLDVVYEPEAAAEIQLDKIRQVVNLIAWPRTPELRERAGGLSIILPPGGFAIYEVH